MRVLFYNHTGQVSGAERVLLFVLARLSGAHFAPVVICPAAGPLKEMVAELGVTCEEVDSLNARFTWRLDHLLDYLGSFLRLVRQVRSQVIRVDPDPIHANSVRAGLVATAATVGLRLPVIWHVRDMLPRHPLSTAIRFVVLCSQRTRIVAISNAVVERFRGRILRGAKMSARITVILNAVDLEKFHPDSASRQKTRDDLKLSRTEQAVGIVGQLTPLEVNAAGRPVIAYGSGGALETVVDGVTGLFFNEPTTDSLAQAIEDFETRSWDRATLRRHAEKFDRAVFATRFMEFLKSVAPAFRLQTTSIPGYKETARKRNRFRPSLRFRTGCLDDAEQGRL